MSDQVQARATDMAHGGSAVAKIEGKAFFVDGALPGELFSATIEIDKGSWGRLRLHSIEEPSPDRIEPACPHFPVCGGCQWQQGAYSAQLEWKRSIVSGQLRHLGRHPDPPVRPPLATGDPFGYRNRMDYKVADGRPALYARRSKTLVPLHECPILHPNLSSLLTDLGNLSGVESLTMRTSVTTGECLVIIEGRLPRQASSWGCNVAVLEPDGSVRAIHGDAILEEEVADVRFRISGKAFFQNNTPGAEALVRVVTEAAGVDAGDTLLDAYAGGGLFAATLGREAARVLAIEIDEVAATDLHANLNRAGIDEFRIIRSAMEDAVERIDEYWDVVIADPPRKGLGRLGVDAITAAEPRTVVYVSCDPASLARDTALLDELDYELEWVAPVDLFPQTFHVEAVARFTRRD